MFKVIGPWMRPEELVDAAGEILEAAEAGMERKSSQLQNSADATETAMGKRVEDHRVRIARLQSEHTQEVSSMNREAQSARSKAGELAKEAGRIGSVVEILR